MIVSIIRGNPSFYMDKRRVSRVENVPLLSTQRPRILRSLHSFEITFLFQIYGLLIQADKHFLKLYTTS